MSDQKSGLLFSCVRHILAHLEGEIKDIESGAPHLDMAFRCLAFASEHVCTAEDLGGTFGGDETRNPIPSKPGDSVFEDLEMYGVLPSTTSCDCGNPGHASVLQREVCRIRAEVERGEVEPSPEVQPG